MDKLKWIPAAAGMIMGYLYGGWIEVIGFLLLAMVIDYASGVWASVREARNGTGPGLSSRVGFEGLARKVMILALIAIAHKADQALGGITIPIPGLELTGKHMIRDGVAWFYCGNELLSIMENAGRMNVPIPGVLRQVVAVLRGKDGGMEK